tara:strand:- start:84 stop:689 length:606 start_codon:yes stop_codon:yes gene_type:complete
MENRRHYSGLYLSYCVSFGYEEWNTSFQGHEIRVVNTWFSGAKLYVDGECVDRTYRLIALGGIILSTKIEPNDLVIDVAMEVISEAKVKIYANNELIGGDFDSVFKYSDYTLGQFGILSLQILTGWLIWFFILLQIGERLLLAESIMINMAILIVLAGLTYYAIEKILKIRLIPESMGGVWFLIWIFIFVGGSRLIFDYGG